MAPPPPTHSPVLSPPQTPSPPHAGATLKPADGSPSGRRAFHYPLTPSASTNYVNAFFVDLNAETPRDGQHHRMPTDEESLVAHDDAALLFESQGAARAGPPVAGAKRRSSVDDHLKAFGLGLTGLTTTLGSYLKPGESREAKRKRSMPSVLDAVSTTSHSHRVHKASFFPAMLSRRSRPMLVVVLLLLSAYLIYTGALSSPAQVPNSASKLRKAPVYPAKHSPTKVDTSRSYTWQDGEELAGLVGFLTSEGTHALPPISSTGRVDPDLVLDFDPLSSSNLGKDMADMLDHVWSERVVVLFGRMNDPKTRSIKDAISAMEILPPPVFIEVNSRADSEHLIPVLERLLEMAPHENFPATLLVGGKVFSSDTKDFKLDQLKAAVRAARGSFKTPKLNRIKRK